MHDGTFTSDIAIEYLGKRYRRVRHGMPDTIHCVGFQTPFGRQLAIEPKPEKVKTQRCIKVWLEDEPIGVMGVQTVRPYPATKSRNHHLKQHAPKLSVGNKAIVASVDSLSALKGLCDWYEISR